MITWDLATGRDVDEFYGQRPSESLQAFVIKLNGIPVGILGLAREPDRLRAFSEYRPELEPYLRSIAVGRAIFALMKLIKGCNLPVYAMAEFQSPNLLDRLGFTPINNEMYVWVT